MLSIYHVTKRYGELKALDDISLQIERGEFFGLLGPNGAGKTTLMNLLVGLRQPDAGTLTILGRRVVPSDLEVRAELGFVPQQIGLYDELSAHENLLIFGSYYRLDRKTLRARANDVLELVQLSDRRKDKVKHFSGGMKRRLNIAASLLHTPPVLLCDEPTVGVDPQSRNAIFDLLTELNRQGTTIVYTSHYMEEVERLCNRMAIIDHGTLMAEGTLEELLRRLPYDETLTVKSDTGQIREALGRFGDVAAANGGCELKLRRGEKMSEAVAVLERAGIPYAAMEWQRPTLEALFLHMTGRRMRD